MRFAAPANFWLLLLVPLGAALMTWALVRRHRALLRFAEWSVAQRLVVGYGRGRQVLKAVLVVAGIGWLALALTRPQFGTKLSMARQRGVDVVVALDVSRSMLAEDMRPNRLAHATLQIRELLQLLAGNRVGLVLFAGQAYVQCPLTLDYGAVELFLDIAGAETVPVQGTALSDALRVAGRCFAAQDRHHKVVIVFTDGESHQGDPAGAARELAATGVRVFTVGLGSPDGELIPVRDGQDRVSFHRDDAGRPVKTRLDEAALQAVAMAADGAYFRSSLSGRELELLADEVSGMDRKDLGSRRFTQYEERYQIFCAIALLCLAIEAFLRDGAPRSSEWRGRFA